MRTPLLLQPDYTVYRGYYQIKLPLEMDAMIPADDSVRLLSAFVEGMDLSELYATYDRVRKNQASPRQMLKIMIYASMNRLFSSRDIETACKRDINFMFLLEGMPAPDHATIARFISLHLSACSRELLANVTSMLYELGEISGKTVFIDGTKIESRANKYTFVWKKSVTKNQARLFEKIVSFIEECEQTKSNDNRFYQSVNWSILRMLTAYDNQTEKNPKMIETTLSLNRWLIENDPDKNATLIHRINQMQILKRMNKLSATDKEFIFEILDAFGSSDAIKFACYTLLGNKETATRYFNRLPAKAQSEFKSMPIYTLFDSIE